MIPRGFYGGTIVGGTKEPGEWDANVSQRTRATLAKSMPELAELSTDGKHAGGLSYEIIQDIVGRRPTRDGGVRLEVERRPKYFDEKGKTLTIVHAYGAGGRGYEISWGVAEEVRCLVERVLAETREDLRHQAKL